MFRKNAILFLASIILSAVLRADPPCPPRLASLFAGRAPIEARLADWLGADVDAYELRPAEERRGRIRFIARDLVRMPPGREDRYDVVLVLNPWIHARTIRLINADPIVIPYSPPRNDVVAPAAATVRAAAGQIGTAVPIPGSTVNPATLAARFAEPINQMFVEERLGQLYGAVDIARDYTLRGGRIFLLTELVHTVALRNGEGESDTLLEWPVWTEAATRMIREGFPNLTLTRNPDGLRERLVRNDDRFGTPWGPASVEAWELRVAP